MEAQQTMNIRIAPGNGNTADNESEAPANESPEPTTYENNSFKDVSLT